MHAATRTMTWRTAAVLGSLALLAVACGGRDKSTSSSGGGGGEAASQGITDTTIKIGTSLPFSGPGSAYAQLYKGAGAYFKYVNEEKGGVKAADGKTRKITLIGYDDQYTAPKTVENINRLLDQDQVFGTFAELGTAPNLAVREVLNQRKVPQLYLNTGFSGWGSQKDKYPMTMGFIPPYSGEAAIYAELVKQKLPNAKVAMIYQNDDFGKDLLTGFETAIKGSGVTLVGKQSYQLTDPTVDSQVTNLAASGADVFLNFGQSKQASQAIAKAAQLKWKPQMTILGSFSASIASVLKPAGLANSEGTYTGVYAKDPVDPQWANDAGLKEYKRIVGKYGEGVNADDGITAAGFNEAEVLTKAIEGMKKPTGTALADSARNMKDVQLTMMVPGIKINTSPSDGFPVESLEIAQFKTDHFALSGTIIDKFEGKTPVPPTS